jgi:hypothetical protein
MATKKKKPAAAGDAAAAPTTTTGYSVHLSVRLHSDLLARLDALVPVFAADASLAPTGRADRSDVLRAALLEGLGVIEGKPPKTCHRA